MTAVRITAQSDEAREFIEGLAAALSGEELDRIVERVALKVLAMLVTATPKGYTGNLRNRWTMVRNGEAQRILSNITTVETSRGPVFLLDMLADGTGRYGPAGTDVVSPTGARMYIPLNRRAAFGWRPGLRYGVDFVLAKQVKGIRPRKDRKVVENVAPRAEKLLESELDKHLRSQVGI